MSDTDKFTILIADDHPLVRKGIVTMLSEESDFQVVGEAKDSETTQSLCTQLKPNVLLLDLNMPGSSWLETLTVVKEVSPHTRVLVLTASADINTVRQTVSAGAVGYIVKEEGLLVVMEALRTVLAGVEPPHPQGDGDSRFNTHRPPRKVLHRLHERISLPDVPAGSVESNLLKSYLAIPVAGY